MRKLLRIVGYAVVAIGGLALVTVVAVYLISARLLASAPAPQPSRLAQPTAEQLADAPRQLRVLGCVGCHGANLQGQLFFDEPGLAKLFAPNVALLAVKMSDGQLDHAIRQGIGHDGRPLLVMPSQQYQFLSDSEVAALIAAIRKLPRGGMEQPPKSVGPLGRIGLVIGKFKTAPATMDEYRSAQLPDFGPQFARGRHIVQTDCTECHGPQLKGKEVKPGTLSPDLSIAGAYDLGQFKAMLRTGIGPGNKNIGMMGEVARSDFSHMTDGEIAAVHAYLVERAQRTP